MASGIWQISDARQVRIACSLMTQKEIEVSFPAFKISMDFPFFTQDGSDREGDDNQHISNMKNGAIARFKYFDFNDVARITVKTRGSGKGQLIVSTEVIGSQSDGDLRVGEPCAVILQSSQKQVKQDVVSGS